MDKGEDMTSGTEYGCWHGICQKYMQEQRAEDWRYLRAIGKEVNKDEVKDMA